MFLGQIPGLLVICYFLKFMLLMILCSINSANLFFHDSAVVDLDDQEPPNLIQAVDLLLPLDGFVLEPQFFGLGLRNCFGELRTLVLIVRLRLHAFLPDLAFLERDCHMRTGIDYPRRSVTIALVV